MKRTALVSVSLIFLSTSAIADGETARKCKGSSDERVKCLEALISALEDRISIRIADLELKNEQKFLQWESVVSIKSQRRAPALSEEKCVDLATQGESTIYAHRCNNVNNHNAQYWKLTKPVSGN